MDNIRLAPLQVDGDSRQFWSMFIAFPRIRRYHGCGTKMPKVCQGGVERRRGCWDGHLGGGQKRLIKAVQLCWCACVRRNGDGLESWNDDLVPAILPGKEGRDTERAIRATQ